VYLLDTNVLSLLIKAKSSVALLENLRRHPVETLFTSCICVMELRHGAVRREDTGALWRRIEQEILSRVQVLDIGMAEAVLAGDILAHLRARGQPIDVEDVLIGATALSRGFAVVTNNLAHFRRIPSLRSEDWTSGPHPV
jgi:tRNA(fMet)-specific endonuclease VapC